MDVPDSESIVSAVLASKKYRSICVDTVRGIARRELANHGNVKAATKATKRRLHQVYAAFEGSLDYDAALEQLRVAYSSTNADSEAEIRSICRRILNCHASTRERLPILDQFYTAVSGITGKPGSILDLGCGLNPLTVPWMGLAPQSPYIALDIDSARIRFLNHYLELADLQPRARCQDILVHPPDDAADLALLLKMSPSLERQQAGATGLLIERLRTPFVVVSFSVKSLGGREKGMLDHYQRQFLALARDRRWTTGRIVFDTELVLIIDKTRKRSSMDRSSPQPALEAVSDSPST
jgi:16S rRNA (guanine(1405)-N(7))-methyltransferase